MRRLTVFCKEPSFEQYQGLARISPHKFQNLTMIESTKTQGQNEVSEACKNFLQISNLLVRNRVY